MNSLNALIIALFAIIVLGTTSPSWGQTISSEAQTATFAQTKVSPRTINFHQLNLAKKSLKSHYLFVSNNGKNSITAIFGEPSAPFTFACSCQEVEIPPHRAVRAIVAFEPAEPGSYTGSFTIDINAKNGARHVLVKLKGTASGTLPNSAPSLSGAVQGADAPVEGAVVNLYAAGPEANRTDAALLASTATDGHGRFTFPRVQCSNPDSPLYVVSSGGSPNGCQTRNDSLSLMTVVGTCGDLHRSSFVTIDAATTAASASTLAPFTMGYHSENIGNSSGTSAVFATARQIASAGSASMAMESLEAKLAECSRCGGLSTPACQHVLACDSADDPLAAQRCSESPEVLDTLGALLSVQGASAAE